MPHFRPVLTPVGGAVLVIALVGLIRALLNRNAYEVVLTCTALLVLLFFGIIGFWKSRKLKSLEPGWKTPFPMTASAGDDEQHQTNVTGLADSIPLFFRQHFIVRGRFFPCGLSTGAGKNAGAKAKGCFVSAETSVPRAETTAQLPLDFPMSGVLKADGFCQLRDIFGFFTFSCGQRQYRTVNVRSSPCFGNKAQINAQTGAEDQRNKPAADIERYYMREYTPGDRFRDINWKSSEKIDTLITRISTDNQEKVSRIEIHFRNYGPMNSSLDALWLLDRAKARLSFFLRSLMEQNSNFIFDVHTANGNWEISNLDELDVFFEELAGISFLPPQHETVTLPGTGDLYVFSTACDTGLQSFLLVNSVRPINLFLIQPKEKAAKGRHEQKGKQKQDDTEYLKVSDFFQKNITMPVQLYSKPVKRLSVQTDKMEIFYAGLKL